MSVEAGGRRSGLSDAVHVALNPSPTYAALVSADPSGSWRRVISSLLFCAALIGATATVAATGTISALTFVSVAVCWSFVPAVQLLTALIVIRAAPTPRVSPARALELLFEAHLPWSAWLIGIAATAALWPQNPLLFPGAIHAMLLPAIWTPVLIASFCRTVLGCTQRDARRRTAVHQFLTWAVILVLALLTTTPWARVGGGTA